MNTSLIRATNTSLIRAMNTSLIRAMNTSLIFTHYLVSYTMEPLNKGHIGTSHCVHYREVVLFLILWIKDTLGPAIVSTIERLSSPWRSRNGVLMVYCYGNDELWDCPFFFCIYFYAQEHCDICPVISKDRPKQSSKEQIDVSLGMTW